MVEQVDLTTTEITSMLSLLSSSVINGQKLPPYLKVPAPYQLEERLEAIDKDILSVNHVLDPGCVTYTFRYSPFLPLRLIPLFRYSAFAVMQISSLLIHDDLSKLIRYELRNILTQCNG